MLQALLRLEDIGPGGYYETADSQHKLLVIADYLYKIGVPFQAAVIARYVDPGHGVDRSIAAPRDPAAFGLLQTLRALSLRGASLGMHGYTHQYGLSVSGEGYEFAYPGCSYDCAPDDSPESLTSMALFRRSYAYGRFHMALSAFHAAGLRPDWFEKPHYTASENQRQILEACSWLFYENNPEAPDIRQVSFRNSGSILGKTYYVPTPLGYVAGTSVEQDVKRIIGDTSRLAERDLASFFYHPFLEFPYIHIRRNAPLFYEDRSPLKRIVQHLLSINRRFVSIQTVVKKALMP